MKKQLEFITTFCTPLFVGKIDKDLTPLLNECKNEREDSEGRVISNKGGWQSEDFNGDKLKKYLGTTLEDITTQWGIRGILSPSNYWYNVNTNKDYNNLHNHPGSVFSGIIYLQCPQNSSPIIFQNPVSNLVGSYVAPFIDFDFSPYISFQYTHQVKKGDILIFPSWIEHRVDSGDYEGERISLSFNTKVIIPSTRKSYSFQ